MFHFVRTPRGCTEAWLYVADGWENKDLKRGTAGLDGELRAKGA
jgi:hypothetical protein